MSFFDKDDFYSTNRPLRTRLRVEDPKPFSGGRRRLRLQSRQAMLLASAAGGAIIMLVLVLLITAVRGGGATPVSAAGAGQGTGLPGGPVTADPVVKAVDKIGGSVVSVVTSKNNDKGDMQPFGMGSGVVFQKDGNKVLVMTNNHVVDEGMQFEVVTADGVKKSATLIGKDRISDLAVLETDASGIDSVAEFGDSKNLKRGETVVAIGNPLGMTTSVTKGIVSSVRQTVPVSLSGDGDIDWEMDMIQTDAAINEGNSGGALVDLDGRVIGINTLKIANITVEGMGFAIPIDDVIPVLQQLIHDKKVKRPLIGVSMQNLQSFKGTEVLGLPSDIKTGVLVLSSTGPADKAGIQSQDVITAVDGKRVNTILELRKYLYKEKKIGDTLSVTLYRGEKKQTVDVVLAESEG